MTMRRLVLGVAVGLLLLSLPFPASGQEWMEMRTARQPAGADSLRLRVQYGAGRLQVGPTDEDLLYQAFLRYDATTFEPLRSFSRTGGTAEVELGVESSSGGLELDADWHELSLDDLDIGDLDLDEAERGRLEVRLSRRVPTDLQVATGASVGELELGGIPITRLRLAVGASETTVGFDAPNPAAMEELRIRAGAASLRVQGLGNARAREIRVDAGVGEVVLDFSGTWTRDARAVVKTGVGAVTLRVPREVGVKLKKSSILSSFSGFGLAEADDGSYRSENWEEAPHRLEVEVDAAFGSIDVERVP